MKTNNYFTLYPCCILVKGIKKGAICDVQRNDIYTIPLEMIELLEKNGHCIDFNAILNENLGCDDRSIIEEFKAFLNENDFGFFGKQINNLRRLDLGYYEENRLITNSIVDIDDDSEHDISLTGSELTEIECESLELRYFGDISSETIAEHLHMLENTSLRNIEILKKYPKNMKYETEVNHFKYSNFRVTKVTYFNSPYDRSENGSDYITIHTSKNIVDETSCGCISENYCVANTQLFIEAIHFNSCLNRKICVDRQGNIKNCPSMIKTYGNINETYNLREIAESANFQYLWNITKNKIEVCRDCERRFVCQDCRDYILDPNNIYSKPLKCNYNPDGD